MEFIYFCEKTGLNPITAMLLQSGLVVVVVCILLGIIIVVATVVAKWLDK